MKAAEAISCVCSFSAKKNFFDDWKNPNMRKALKKTFENRGHHFTIEQFEQVTAFGRDDTMRKKWKAFCRKIDTKTDDFDTVLKTMQKFLTEPFTAAVEAEEYSGNWSALDEKWRLGGEVKNG